MKKYNKLIIVLLIAFFVSVLPTSAKTFTVDSLGAELESKETQGNNIRSAFIIGNYVFTSQHKLTTEDVMLAARSINPSNAVGKTDEDDIYGEMAIYLLERNRDDDGNTINWYINTTNVAGTSTLPESFKIEYIDYKFVKDTYTVEFEVDGEIKKSIEVKENTAIQEGDKPETPSKEGYKFLGWYYKDQLFNFETKVNTAMKLVAKFKETTIEVSNEEELKNALKDKDIEKITLKNNFSVNSEITIDRAVTIEGKTQDVTITGTGNIITVDGTEEIEVTFKNFKITGGESAITVGENAKLTVENLDVSGNTSFGIKVQGELVVTDGLTYSDEIYGKPVIKIEKEDKDKAKVTIEPEYVANDDEGKQYYLKEEHSYQTFTVTIDPKNGEKKTTQKVKKDDSATKPETDPKKDGYVFDGWYSGDVEYKFTEQVTGDITVEAKWKSTTIEVSDEENLNKALQDKDIVKIILKNSFQVESQVTVDRAVTIEGENKEVTITGTGNIITVDGSEEEIEVTFKNFKITGGTSAITVGENANLTVENIDVSGNESFGIEVKGKLTASGLTYENEEFGKPVVKVDSTYKETASVNITDKYFPDDEAEGTQYYLNEKHSYQEFTVTFNADNSSENTTQKVKKGELANKPSPDPVKEGFIFKGWEKEGVEYTFEEPVTEDIELKAKWKSTTKDVTDEATLKEALTDEDIKNIVIKKSFEVTNSVNISRNVTIDATNGDDKFTITGPDNDVIFVIEEDATVTFNNINFKAGIAVINLKGTVKGKNIAYESEEYGKPLISVEKDYFDKAKSQISATEVQYTDKNQKHYYLDANHSHLFSVTFLFSYVKYPKQYKYGEELGNIDIFEEKMNNDNLYSYQLEKWTDTNGKEYNAESKVTEDNLMLTAQYTRTLKNNFKEIKITNDEDQESALETIKSYLKDETTKGIVIESSYKDEDGNIVPLEIGNLEISKDFTLGGNDKTILKGTITIKNDANVLIEDLQIVGDGSGNTRTNKDNRGEYTIIDASQAKNLKLVGNTISNGEKDKVAFAAVKFPDKPGDKQLLVEGNDFKTDNIYNTLEFGHTSNPSEGAKDINIFNNRFYGTPKHNHINIYSLGENAKVKIWINSFDISSNAVRLSNANGNSAKIIINQNDTYATDDTDEYKYAGFMLLQNSNDVDDFSKYDIQVRATYLVETVPGQELKKRTKLNGDSLTYGKKYRFAYYATKDGNTVGDKNSEIIDDAKDANISFVDVIEE